MMHEKFSEQKHSRRLRTNGDNNKLFKSAVLLLHKKSISLTLFTSITDTF